MVLHSCSSSLVGGGKGWGWVRFLAGVEHDGGYAIVFWIFWVRILLSITWPQFFGYIASTRSIERWNFFRRCTWYRPQRRGQDFAATLTKTASTQITIRASGLSSLNPLQTERARQSNREMEAVSLFAAQSARCKVRRVGLVLLFPEDFGGHVRDGPASPWSSREFQDLEGSSDVRRGSAFLCQLASTDQRRPVGILTNLPTLQNRLSLHWPILERSGDELFYQGPLPESCPCVPAHAPFNGTDAEEHFVSSSSQSPGTVFWTVWPTSTWTTSIPLGMEAHSYMLISVPRFHSLFVPFQSIYLWLLGGRDAFAFHAYGFWELWTGWLLIFGLFTVAAGLVVVFFNTSSRHFCWSFRCRHLLPRCCFLWLCR